MGWFIGVDVGGTFTDFHAVNVESGEVRLHKTPSTPDNPARAILDGVRALAADAGIDGDDIARLAHGTTVGTNALIQRKGADVAVITTDGFRDLLEIGRQIRPKMFDLKADHPPPLAPRHMRFEIVERIGSKGQVIRPLTDEAIAAAVEEVAASGAPACAVGLLFSFLNGDHEQRIGAALRARLPELSVSLSSEVQPEFREYERFSTTLLNAYLQPLLGRYMRHLGERLSDVAPAARLGINQSSGGLMSIERAGAFPIRTALSGPAAGTVGAVHQAKAAGRPNVITLDMGGTSADVALIRDYTAGLGFDRSVAGFPIRLPMIDIHTVGAGGGSIAWFDRDGLLKVGPMSAGADPGPACYGRGGTEATVSDANLALGRLSGRLVGGAMTLDHDKARTAIEPIARKLGFTVEKTAHGMLGIVVANMVRAIRTISVERGHDPRDFALMPFGGAGPLHAGEVARALDMREIVVPPAPGILCAQGLVVSDLKEDFVVSRRLPLDAENLPRLAGEIEALAAAAEGWFADEAVAPRRRAYRLALDLRYVRQNFELTVPASESGGDEDRVPRLPDLDVLRTRFYEAHERTYGHFTDSDPIEVVNVRLSAIGRAELPLTPPAAPATGVAVPIGRRTVWFDAGHASDTAVFQRADLLPGHVLEGPASVEQLDATTIIHPGDTARVDDALNLVISVAGGSR
jgi:N-methylhydantoinase A